MTAFTGLSAVLLAVGGGVLYHLSAKSIPKDLAPTLVLVTAYAVALGASILAHASLTGGAGTTVPSRLAHPAVIGLGLGAVMIEMGYVLTYRAAWPVSVASVFINGMVAVLLVPLGVALFSERLSFTRATGVLLCLAGVWLLRR